VPRTRAADLEAAERVAAVMALQDDTPTEPVIVLVRPRSSGGTDATIAENVVKLAVLAELDHFANTYSYQVKTVATLSGILADMAGQLADRRLIDADLIRRGFTQFEGMAIQGQDEDEGGGS